MAQPLTKKTAEGQRYTRPAEIEAAIDAALAADRPTLLRRAAIFDRRAAEYLPPECLVHLIRKAGRDSDEGLLNQLLPFLLGRCTANLAVVLRGDWTPNAEEVREEVLGRLAEHFAEDRVGKNPDRLDYFEIRFNDAFAALRVSLVRRDAARSRHHVPIAELADRDTATPGSEEETISRVKRAAAFHPADQEHRVFRAQVVQAINALPPEERKAAVLCWLMGHKEESEDPAVPTAARACGVTGRTIRNRLKRAAVALSRLLKEET